MDAHLVHPHSLSIVLAFARRPCTTCLSAAFTCPSRRRKLHASPSRSAAAAAAAASDPAADRGSSSSSRPRTPASPPHRRRGSHRPDVDLSFPSHLLHPTPFDIFHLPRGHHPPSVIKGRYYDLVRALHPDVLRGRQMQQQQERFEQETANSGDDQGKGKGKARDDGDAANEEDVARKREEQFKLVIAAFDLLSDPARRDLYLRSGYGWGDKPPSSSPSPYPPRRPGAPRAGWEYRGDVRPNAGFGSWSQFKTHDGFGWQRAAAAGEGGWGQGGVGDDGRFYGFYDAHYYQNGGQRGGGDGPELYASNSTFIGWVAVATFILAIGQALRLQSAATMVHDAADRAHLDAALNLEKARNEAKRTGRERREMIRRRVREGKVIGELDDLHVHHVHHVHGHGRGSAGHLGLPGVEEDDGEAAGRRRPSVDR